MLKSTSADLDLRATKSLTGRLWQNTSARTGSYQAPVNVNVINDFHGTSSTCDRSNDRFDRSRIGLQLLRP